MPRLDRATSIEENHLYAFILQSFFHFENTL